MFLPKRNVNELWIGWNKHCFTWKTGEEVKWYTSQSTKGFMELVSKAIATDDTVLSGGYLTLLQKQGEMAGSFDIRQTVTGEIAEFNMWDFEMNMAQINTKTCGYKGNVASWDTLQKDKADEMTTKTFPPCDAKVEILRTYTQEHSIYDYLYQRDLPGLSELTTCFWYYSDEGISRNDIYLISIATTERSNEFQIGWDKDGNLALEVRYDSIALELMESDDMSNLWDFWHKHCFTWKAGGQFKVQFSS
ncbi:C-reactive protein-like [Watersipora subatra]|uniref:C-reactive protein-like n=1 Tax=Watersipora subatra TaxID=2589382 RepID=UPI00355B5716